MKHLILLALLLLSFISSAQVEKGMFLVSGNLSYQKNGGTNVTNTEVIRSEFTPQFGYMITSRIALGLTGGYTKNEQTLAASNMFSATKITDELVSVGPYVRYYQPITGQFYFFVQGDLIYAKGTGTQRLTDPSFTSKAELTSTSIAVRPGVSYFISKRWAVEVILGSVSYSSRNYKGGNNAETASMDGFAFNFITRGLSPGVVFTF